MGKQPTYPYISVCRCRAHFPLWATVLCFFFFLARKLTMAKKWGWSLFSCSSSSCSSCSSSPSLSEFGTTGFVFVFWHSLILSEVLAPYLFWFHGRVCVASTNPVKLKAVETAFQSLFSDETFEFVTGSCILDLQGLLLLCFLFPFCL